MKKIIKEFPKEGIVQITIADERWYVRDVNKIMLGDKKQTQEIKLDPPQRIFVPSVTWIAGKYPKGTQFYKWLADRGWDEAEAIKQAAGDKGSKVHQAIVDIIEGKTVNMDSKYTNPSTEKEEELSLEEYECLMSFVDWYEKFKPEILDREFVVWGDGYAGTVDLLCKINNQLYLIDFKTSQSIWPEYELQVSAYSHALVNILKQGPLSLAILQIGYRLNYRRDKQHFKFTEIEDKFKLFKAAQLIWKNEHGNETPSVKDYPTSLKIETTYQPKVEDTNINEKIK